ncbi:pilus assembly protein CpaF [Silvibacterium bohemicum]|uniref:Pilus assembly protein CpaF n=1 Tax=Silvibacterium bohemicum TaxID=1577686 RepID=A0A841JYE0_9BACT|nr:ATPase, T2SS/T4P/T4SS family [Silvibacterium bohemicum]MBB6142984.1 pilus assembly protein CpaF [Silvibacterium bohemicum]
MSFDIIIPFLKPIEHLLSSQTISEIMVNPDGSVWMEEKGRIVFQPDIQFEDGALLTSLEVIANRFGKKLDADSPILNLRLPDGSRMAALIPPVVNPQPMITIRKFTSRGFTMDDLIERRMLTADQGEQLSDAIRRGDNLLISGGTGAGKTTLTNVIAGFIPDNDRILILEDVAELYIKKQHVISAEAQLDTHKSQIGFSDLLKAALRHRPDRIIVGEIRGPEARVFLDALNTGHRGSLSTIHANSAGDALRRLAQLAMRGSGGVPLSEVMEECRCSIDLVTHVANQDGWRHVTEIRTANETLIASGTKSFRLSQPHSDGS